MAGGDPERSGTADSRSRNQWLITCAAGVGLLVLNLVISHTLRWYNSDDVALQTILGQWRRGYHETAHLGADSFVLKFPLYLFVDSVVEKGRGALLLTSLVLNVTGFALFVIAVRYFTIRFAVGQPHLVMWPLLWLAGLGLILADTLINPNLRNLEIGLAFLLAMLVAKSWDKEVTPSPAWLLLAVPMLALFVYDDPYFLFVWIVPLIALLTAAAVVRRFDRRAAVLAAVLAAGAFGYWVLDLGLRGLGLRPAKASTSLANLEAIRHHVRLLVHGGLRLFEADLISNPMSLTRPRPFLNLAVLALALLYPVALWRRHVPFREQPWKWFFGLHPLLVAAVFVFSNQAHDLDSARYLILIPFVLVLVIGVGLDELPSRRMQTAAAVLVVTATAVNVIVTVDYVRREPRDANRLHFHIVDAARSSGLVKGYAGYWSSNINTYLSGDRVDFIQVRCRESKAEPYKWLVDDGILAKPASRTFYLWEGDDLRSGCEYQQLLQQFGEPAEVIAVTNDKWLLVFEYDLVERM